METKTTENATAENVENKAEERVINGKIVGTVFGAQGFNINFDTELGAAMLGGIYPTSDIMELLLRCAGANRWEDLLGCAVRLWIKGSEISYIGHIIADFKIPCSLFAAQPMKQEEEDG